MNISTEDLDDLKYAKSLLENVGFAAKITNSLGEPIEKGFDLLPEGWAEIVASTTQKALQVAVNSAKLTMVRTTKTDSADTLHKIMVAGTGAAGGFWGLPALAIELPLSTTIMLRSIADIARSEGHLLADPQVKIECIEVFALGGPGNHDDAVETGYFAIRAGLATAVTDAAKHIAQKEISETGAPVLIKLITQIASRFGIQVSEKIAAQAVPVIGAAGGAIINSLFIDHFQGMARGHFIVLRLENKYGAEEIKQVYLGL